MDLIEIVKLLIDKNVDLEAENMNKYTTNPLCMYEWICRNCQITY